MTPPPPRLAWTVWGLGALLYLFAFYQRVAPAVMTDQLMAEFAIGGPLLGGVLLQPGVGWLLDRYWNGTEEGGVRLYDAAAWQSGFALLFVTVLVALLLVPFIRETHCRQNG